jgi:sigma-54 dependent transcriptional regulator, flagellar regulatory protein
MISGASRIRSQEMQLGQENSNRLSPTAGPRFSSQARHLVGPRENEDRSSQLDLRIPGESHLMRGLKDSIVRAAGCDSTVLIVGESGTGKELVARSIHDFGHRQREPFLAINCGALTESLLESELFGHVKGAFTGATTYKKGVFEVAGKGTIFLDEFGEMTSPMQVRLLRVLQEHKVRPVGSEDSREINFNARVEVATNRDLKREVAKERFRQDLYYRINVFPIRSPALRDRLDDLRLLIDVLLKRLIDKSKLVRPLRFDSDALALLQNYSWPGNVRELENVIERLAINVPAAGLVSSADISFALELNGSGESNESREIILSKELNCLRNSRATVRHTQKRQELDFYLTELGRVGGNLTKAARRLGINRSTLHMRIKRLEMKLGSLPQAE